MMTEKKYR